jgi:hypothetical protein
MVCVQESYLCGNMFANSFPRNGLHVTTRKHDIRTFVHKNGIRNNQDYCVQWATHMVAAQGTLTSVVGGCWAILCRSFCSNMGSFTSIVCSVFWRKNDLTYTWGFGTWTVSDSAYLEHHNFKCHSSVIKFSLKFIISYSHSFCTQVCQHDFSLILFQEYQCAWRGLLLWCITNLP